MIRVVNIKEGNPNTDYALFLLDEEIKYSRAIGNRVIVVIHGYGSHGQGGLIKEVLKQYLPELKKKHLITDFVYGEKWGDLNETKKLICSICPEAILNDNLQGLNSGVSVILL